MVQVDFPLIRGFYFVIQTAIKSLGVENLSILLSLSMSVKSNDDDDSAHHNLASMAEM